MQLEDVYVYERPLPGHCREMVGQTNDATVIIVNSNLSEEQKLSAVRHAMRHIELGHFDGVLTADEAEHEAHSADAVLSPDLASRLRSAATDEEIPVLRVETRKRGE